MPQSAKLIRLTTFGLVAAFCFTCGVQLVSAAALDEMPTDRWAKLREAERYQLNIAEKYYREKNYKVAMAEYEKFMTLYDKSEGASYAHLKWSLCQAEQRKLNTAIKDGYQSIIDYWPESPEAISASYLMARTYKDMGEVKKAKAQYATVLANHGKHLVTVYAKNDLLDIARTENEASRRLTLLKELTFDTERNRETSGICANASRELANLYFYQSAFPQGKDALATTYNEQQVPGQVVAHARNAVSHLTGSAETKAQGEKLAEQLIQYIKENTPKDISTDEKKKAAKDYWYWIADVQWSARHPEKVIEVYEQMLKSFGTDDELLNRMADWFRSQNRRDDARRTYGRFENQISGQDKIAGMYREEKKWDEALNIYRNLMSQDADHVKNWQWNLAHTLREAGRYKEAITAYRVIDSFPENLNYMAWCHRHLKEYSEAIILYNQIMSSAPHAPEALLQIGYTYESATQKEKAIQTFQQVCRKYPKLAQASRAHAHLQNQYKITATLGGAKDD